MRSLSTFTMGCALLTLLSTGAAAQRNAIQAEFTPEEYSDKGLTNGCGISFVTAWSGDEGELIAVTGSANFFFVPEHKNVMAMVKATGFVNGKETPLTYAWLETAKYGRSTDFKKGPAQDANAFVGVKNSDAKTIALVLDIANMGSVLGITRTGRTIDDSVKMAAPPQEVGKKVVGCFSSLEARMRAVLQ